MVFQGPSGLWWQSEACIHSTHLSKRSRPNRYAVNGNCSCLCKRGSHHSVFCWSLRSPTDVVDHLDSQGISNAPSYLFCPAGPIAQGYPRGCQQVLLRLRPYPVRGHWLLYPNWIYLLRAVWGDECVAQVSVLGIVPLLLQLRAEQADVWTLLLRYQDAAVTAFYSGPATRALQQVCLTDNTMMRRVVAASCTVNPA